MPEEVRKALRKSTRGKRIFFTVIAVIGKMNAQAILICESIDMNGAKYCSVAKYSSMTIQFRSQLHLCQSERLEQYNDHAVRRPSSTRARTSPMQLQALHATESASVRLIKKGRSALEVATQRGPSASRASSNLQKRLIPLILLELNSMFWGLEGSRRRED
eukprot:767124-Hanusia_phi.AAC.2